MQTVPILCCLSSVFNKAALIFALASSWELDSDGMTLSLLGTTDDSSSTDVILHFSSSLALNILTSESSWSCCCWFTVSFPPSPLALFISTSTQSTDERQLSLAAGVISIVSRLLLVAPSVLPKATSWLFTKSIVWLNSGTAADGPEFSGLLSKNSNCSLSDCHWFWLDSSMSCRSVEDSGLRFFPAASSSHVGVW